MIVILDGEGLACATAEVVDTGENLWALKLRWDDGSTALPKDAAWARRLEVLVREVSSRPGACLEARVVARQDVAVPGLLEARAALYRDALASWGFQRKGGRVEYRLPLEAALAALNPRGLSRRIRWEPVDLGVPEACSRASAAFRAASEEDLFPSILKGLDDPDLVRSPLTLQVGTVDGRPAAVLAASVLQQDGWSSLSFMGVLPGYRGLGLGRETLVHGLETLVTLGGELYHDGTEEENRPMRALFARFEADLFRVLETWFL